MSTPFEDDLEPEPEPSSSPPSDSDPDPRGATRAPSGGQDVVASIIPYRNVHALVAYYLGVFSVGCLAPLGIPAFILGLIGLRRARANPELKGTVHAWIGIVMGGLSIVLSLTLLVLVALANC